jgi:hypothetical protein
VSVGRPLLAAPSRFAVFALARGNLSEVVPAFHFAFIL